MEMDDMLKLYVKKREEYETKIQNDLLEIEKSVSDIAKPGDYFSIKNDDLLITIKSVLVDDEKHVAIYTDQNPEEIPFNKLSLTKNPDLILWIIQNDKLIQEGFREVLINAVRNGENIINTLKQLKVNYECILKPFVLLNAAMTVDGKIATENSSMKISGENDLIRVHQLRKKYDGIMVGINTVIIDDPKLTIHKIPSENKDNPVRIIIDSKARTPLNSRVLNNDAKTIIITSKKAPKSRINELRKKCDVITVGEDSVDLKEALNQLYENGIKSILLEGGSTLNFSMFEKQLIDKVSICIGSKILGGKNSKTFVDGVGFDKNSCIDLKIESIKRIDNDIVIEYSVIY